MTLIKFNPDNSHFPSLWDNFFGRDLRDTPNFSSESATLPAVNIKETSEEFNVEVAAPGMSKEDFHIELDDNLLFISSEKKESQERKDKEGNYTRKEFSYQSFQRSFTLPKTVAGEKISAKYVDGVLKITIPKKEEAKQKPARRIEIS